VPIFAQNLVVEVTGDVSDAEQKLDRVGDKSDGLGSKLGGLGKAALAAGGAFAVGFGVKSVMAASDVEESLSKVNTIFGKSAGEIDSWAKGAAASFGMSRQQALDTAGSLGNMFTQLGIGVGEASKMSQGITELAADFASFHNADISEVIAAQSAAFRGEYDSLQRFLPLINAATVEQKAMEMTGKANAKALTAQEKALAVHELMLQGAGKAAGDFDRTSGSLANQLRIARASAENFAAGVGSVLLPVVLKGFQLIGSLSDAIKSNLRPVLDGMGNALAPVADKIGQIVDAFRLWREGGIDLAGAISGLISEDLRFLPTIEKIVDGLRPAVEWFQKVTKHVDLARPALIALGAVLTGGLVIALKAAAVAAIGFLAPIAAALAPFAAFGLALAAVVAGVLFAWNKFEGFRNAVFAVLDFITGTVAPALQQFGENLVGWIGDAVGWIVEIWPQISEAFGHVINVLKTLITAVVGPLLLGLVFLWRTIGDDIVNIVKTAFRVVGEVINAVLDVFRGVVQFVLAIINGDWSKAWNSAMAIVRGIWDAFFGFLRGIGNVIQSIIGGFLSILSGALEAAFKGGIEVLKNLPGWIIGAVGDIAGAVIGIGKNVVQGIWNGILSMKDFLIDKIKGFIGDAIPGPMKKVLSIFSPSKVTAGLGEEVARGLVVGMERAKNAVAGAAGALAEASVPTLGGSAGPGVVGVGAGGVSLSITVNGAGDPQATAAAVTDAGKGLVDELLRELRSR